jgi:hypothetical protein
MGLLQKNPPSLENGDDSARVFAFVKIFGMRPGRFIITFDHKIADELSVPQTQMPIQRETAFLCETVLTDLRKLRAERIFCFERKRTYKRQQTRYVIGFGERYVSLPFLQAH